MPTEQSIGANDGTGTEGTTDPAIETTELNPVETIEETPETVETAEETPEEDLSTLAVEATDDTPLVRRLRGVLRNKLEPQALGEREQEALQVMESLFGFDPDAGAPTAKAFAEYLAKKDLTVANQAYRDLANIPVNDEGWTIGHQFLKDIGLDPYKLEELRQFSRGEIQSQAVVNMPEYVPQEYAEAYKGLNEILRADIDIYLNSSDERQRSTALELLRDKQQSINFRAQQEQQAVEAQNTLNTSIRADVDNTLATTYQGLLDAVKTNPAYTNVVVSSNPQADTFIKDSIIAQINAVGDPNRILASQAVAAFKAQGIEIDTAKVSDLMRTIEVNTEIAVKAEKLGKIQNKDYSVQIQEAKRKAADATTRALGLANKYFSQSLANITNTSVSNPSNAPTPPVISSDPASQGSQSNRAKTPKELDEMILGTAAAIQKAAP
jgi:hypothetical protein